MFPEKRRITRMAKCVVYYEDGTKGIEKVPVTNDYIRKGDEISEYVCTTNGERAVSMGFFKITGEKLDLIKKEWKSGEIVDVLRGQKLRRENE